MKMFLEMQLSVDFLLLSEFSISFMNVLKIIEMHEKKKLDF